MITQKMKCEEFAGLHQREGTFAWLAEMAAPGEVKQLLD